MFTHGYKDISSWLKLSELLEDDIVNFVISFDKGVRIVDISKNVEEFFGYKKEDLVSREDALHKIIYHKDMAKLYDDVTNSKPTRTKDINVHFRLLSFNGIVKHVQVNMRYIKDKESKNVYLIGNLVDTTKIKTFQSQIDYLTNFDKLTGLVNRSKIESIIDKEFETNISKDKTSALLYLDLNKFKYVNESFGQAIGDKLLQHVSHRLMSCIGDSDTLARVGDDEFVILLSNINNKTLHTNIDLLAKRVYKILDRSFSIEGNIIHITTSIGISLFGVDAKNSKDLLKAANTAMNTAKKDKQEYFKYYKPNMYTIKQSEIKLESELKSAIKNREFELYFQPQVDVITGDIIGAEALIRWDQPQRGFISPMDFIPIAEESGLIIHIGEWVLNEACKRIKELQEDKSLPNTFKKISVNISSKQFALPNFSTIVKTIIDQHQIDASFLELEVTEGALILNIDDAIEKMNILKDLGIKFSIDDFGTGYSSLTYLKKLPIDIIKIDKSFITNMHVDKDDKVLTQTIIQMSQNLRLELIAEGVEKIEHLTFLQEKGCQSYQGFFFSKPIPFDKFKDLLFQEQLVPIELLQDTVQS